MKTFLLIIAIVFPDGSMDIKHTFVPSCPNPQEVKQIMEPMVESKEILLWQGSCSPLIPTTEASNG